MKKNSTYLDIQVQSLSAESQSQVYGDDYAYLTSKELRKPIFSDVLNLVDLFCGVGGITLGVREAAWEYGFDLSIPLAVDFDEHAINCYAHNFKKAHAVHEDITSLFNHDFDAKLSDYEATLQAQIGQVDFLVGGPPCQGHSDLNNYSRRNDPKNALYAVMGRAAKVLAPNNIIIENVTGAKHDKRSVVDNTANQLSSLGYNVAFENIRLIEIGVPQKRKRLVLFATKDSTISPQDILNIKTEQRRDLRWAIGDIENEIAESPFTTPSTPSKDNKKRIGYLFKNGLYDLPNSERPPCHRNKKHTYNSVYGRLSWDAPAQTITSGFYSCCMGRYVHPSKERTLTAHEAARIQFFPDHFDFSGVKSRTALARLIGNAVPMKLSYLIARQVISSICSEIKS